MAGINWTAEAENCLVEIYDYIAARNPAAAYRTIEGIFQKLKSLKRFLRSDTDTRKFANVRYVSFYTAIIE